MRHCYLLRCIWISGMQRSNDDAGHRLPDPLLPRSPDNAESADPSESIYRPSVRGFTLAVASPARTLDFPTFAPSGVSEVGVKWSTPCGPVGERERWQRSRPARRLHLDFSPSAKTPRGGGGPSAGFARGVF